MYIIVGVGTPDLSKRIQITTLKTNRKSKHLTINYKKNYAIDHAHLRPVILIPKDIESMIWRK